MKYEAKLYRRFGAMMGNMIEKKKGKNHAT